MSDSLMEHLRSVLTPGAKCLACMKPVPFFARSHNPPPGVTGHDPRLPRQIVLCNKCGHLMAVRDGVRLENLTRSEKQAMPNHWAIAKIRERQEDVCRDMWG